MHDITMLDTATGLFWHTVARTTTYEGAQGVVKALKMLIPNAHIRWVTDIGRETII